MSDNNATIEDYFSEDRVFTPTDNFSKQALANDLSLYESAEADFEKFWESQAKELLDWYEPFGQVCEWQLPFSKWFIGGKLNVSFNCLDRHVLAGRGGKVAYYWEGEPGEKISVTYSELLDQVSQFANCLKNLGVKKGDRVAIYMPMILELPIAMLACTRIGAAHSVVFGGFSSDALAGRINDAQAKLVITADGGYRRGATVQLKSNVDLALEECSTVDHVVVVRRTNTQVNMVAGRDVWWDELVEGVSTKCEPVAMDSEDLLFLLYTSGTTAKPKGIMHTTGGYLTQVAYTHKYVFDLKPESDIYWCAADIGWVTGHSYILYGPLTNGATSIIYEGTPDFPDKDRWWDIIERYKVTILYTAPTAIRTFMKWGEEYPSKHDLSSLRLLGSVGEPINPEAWIWYYTHIGQSNCPVVDTWWQTETGGIMISPLPGVTKLKPGSATFALPGIFVEVVDDNGNKVEKGGGYLTIVRPWPGMLRGIYGDPERYRETYWSRFEGRYFAGDGAKVDDDGYLWLLGRVDDVMNVSGHRISTTEVESALVDHPSVAEAAVVGANDPTTGQAIIGFVTLKSGETQSSEKGEELRAHVARVIGAIARPKTIIFTDELPKTRSGKIMRRLLADVANGRSLGDTTTLADPSVVEEIRSKASDSTAED